MNGNRPGTKTLTVTVFVFPGVRLLDVTGPIEVFSSANEFGGQYQVRIASEDGADVITSAGTRLSADLRVDDVREPCDVLLIPGGPEWETLIKDDILLDVVRRLHEKARCTASVCTGAFLLAAAGLLDRRRATTHWRHSQQLALRFPSVRVAPDAIFVRDGKMMTSAGVSAGICITSKREVASRSRRCARATYRVVSTKRFGLAASAWSRSRSTCRSPGKLSNVRSSRNSSRK